MGVAEMTVGNHSYAVGASQLAVLEPYEFKPVARVRQQEPVRFGEDIKRSANVQRLNAWKDD
ncbi:hypothetical protein GCM10027093_68230 [Paraburkholderia jirisanensis]